MDLSIGIYESWRSKQLEKYRELVPMMGEVLEEVETALDIGVGKAWFWDYLKDEGYVFNVLKGVDVSKRATKPEKSYIDYIYSDSPGLERVFDLVVAFDSVHLIDYAGELPDFVSENGYLLQSVPMKYEGELERYGDMKVVGEGEIGVQERDRYLLQRKE